MKKISTLFLVALFCLAINEQLNAQISLLSTDLTEIGDVIVRYNDTIPTYGPGGSGANQTWDFSNAIIDTIVTTTVVSTNSTAFASTFPSSDYAMTGGADSYLFFEHDANTMITTGAAGDLLATGEQIESPFSDHLTLHEFPRTYGSFFDDTYAFITEANGAGLPLPIPVNRVKLTHTGHAFDTTDAYGTLITPTGTYDALRVKTVDFTTDILEYKLFAFSSWATFSNTSDTSVSYSWHAKEEMLAIAEYAYDSIGNPARFTYSSVPPVSTVGLDESISKAGIILYPQPASNVLCVKNLATDNTYSAEVFSISGKLIFSEQLDNSCLELRNLKQGMYVLRLADTKGRLQSIEKFVVD